MTELLAQIQRLEELLVQAALLPEIRPADPASIEELEHSLGELGLPLELRQLWDWCGGITETLYVPTPGTTFGFCSFDQARSSDLIDEEVSMPNDLVPLNLLTIAASQELVYAEITPGSEVCQVWTRWPDDETVTLLFPSIGDLIRVLVDIETTDIAYEQDGEIWDWASPTVLSKYFPALYEGEFPEAKTKCGFAADARVGLGTWPTHWVPRPPRQ